MTTKPSAIITDETAVGTANTIEEYAQFLAEHPTSYFRHGLHRCEWSEVTIGRCRHDATVLVGRVLGSHGMDSKFYCEKHGARSLALAGHTLIERAPEPDQAHYPLEIERVSAGEASTV